MFVGHKFTACISLLILVATPMAFAKKATSLNFDKESIDIEAPILGELLYIENVNGGTDLLIHQSNYFTRIRDLGATNLTNNTKKLVIPESVIFYNKGKLAKNEQDVLFYLTSGSIVTYNLQTETSQTIITDDNLYSNQRSIAPKLNNFVLDINGDGLADVVTSTFTHTNVYIQDSNGVFNKTQLALAPISQITEDGVQFSEHKAHILDVNNDGKTDLAFQVDNKLLAFVQNSKLGIESNSQTISLNAGLLTRKQKAKKRNEEIDNEESKRSVVAFENLKDINNDRVMDLITKHTTTKRKGMSSSNSEYQIRYGELKNGLISFPEKADTTMFLEGDGIVAFSDINNDGKQDVYALSVEFGVGILVSALMSGSIDMDLQVYLMNSNNRYAKKPSYKDEVEIVADKESDTNAEPVLEIQDFNGDGVKDLMLKSDEDELNIIYGTKDKRLFAKSGVKYDTSTDMSGQVDIKDFNLDGKADIMFRSALKEGKSQLMLWLSKP